MFVTDDPITYLLYQNIGASGLAELEIGFVIVLILFGILYWFGH